MKSLVIFGLILLDLQALGAFKPSIEEQPKTLLSEVLYENDLAHENSGTLKLELPVQVAVGGHSSRHLNYYEVYCEAWTKCHNGLKISCRSRGSRCFATYDDAESVTCTAPFTRSHLTCD